MHSGYSVNVQPFQELPGMQSVTHLNKEFPNAQGCCPALFPATQLTFTSPQQPYPVGLLSATVQTAQPIKIQQLAPVLSCQFGLRPTKVMRKAPVSPLP